MMRGLLVAVMGVSLALSGARAEDNLTPFTKDSTLVMNVHKSSTPVKTYIKHGSKHLHAKVVGEDMNHDQLQKFFSEIASTKRAEVPWWSVWSYPSPINVVLEQTEYSLDQFDAITCKVVAEWMHKEVVAASQAHPWWMFGRFNESKSAWGVINVRMGGQLPKECVEDIIARGAGDDLWYIDVAPQLNQEEAIDVSKNVMKKMSMVSFPYPTEQPVRGRIMNMIATLPKGVSRVMITHMPTDKDAMAHARHVLEQMNTLYPGKLILTVDSVAPAPTPSEEPTPSETPVTPSEEPATPSPEPTPVDPEPTPVTPSPKPVDPKKEDDSDVPVDPSPKPEPKPEDKDKKEAKGLETVQIIAWILIVALVCAAGWWFTVGNKEEAQKPSEMSAGLVANEAPSAATGVTPAENKV